MVQGNVKFDFSVACDLTNKLTNCMDVLESENDRVQTNFLALNEHFNDAYYGEFQVEFEKGNRIIETITEDVRDFKISIWHLSKTPAFKFCKFFCIINERNR